MVIYAIGQAPDLSFLNESVGTMRGAVQTDPYTMETSLPGVFAGGDAVSGTGSLIEAITAGKTAAWSIARYLSGKGDGDETV
jgi:thioredoxin reductase